MTRQDFLPRLRAADLLILPGVHDAASARMAEQAGFSAVGIGGSTIAAMHYGLPDLGLMSYGEYEPHVRAIVSACALPAMVDAEHGFGDLKVTARSVERLSALGVGAICLEDMQFPPRAGRPPRVVPQAEITRKLEIALRHRRQPAVGVVGRTDAMATGDFDEVLRRVRRYQEVGVDAVLATGIASADQYRAMRDAVTCPIIAIILESGPWMAPGHDLLREIGIEAALYPAALMLRALSAMRRGLEDLRGGSEQLPEVACGYADVGALVEAPRWAEIDRQDDTHA